MAHIGRVRKKIESDFLRAVTPDPNAVTKDDWLKLIPTVERCCYHMELLQERFGTLAFAVSVSIFHENMPGSTMMQVERLRYHNTRIRDYTKLDGLLRM